MSKRKTIKLTVLGTPTPKARPRVDHRHAYTPRRTKAYEAHVRAECLNAMYRDGLLPIEGAIEVRIEFGFEIPQSWKKAKKQEALLGFIQPTGRNTGDIDNLIKAVLDGLNGVAYEDDCQVVYLKAAMTYAETSYTRITIESAELPRTQKQ